MSTLKDQGFTLNPYDLCTANKIIDGHQCTIVWYVDDNKISHVDEAVVSHVITLIEEKVGKMTVTRGREHTFLGMKITFNKDKTVTIDMSDYIKEAIIDSQEDVSKTATSPATKTLFDIDDDSPVLDKVKADRFHRIAAKLLYICKRGRPDIPLPVAYLCTRVSHSTEEDWGKLKRVLQFLNRTITDHLVLGADCLTILKTWVDAAYGVHPDMKSHTGGAMSLGRGVIMSKSTKQKLNTKSSTEAEVVGASDYLPNTIWAKLFLEAQGYEIQENTFYQDNQSAMKLETNGRASCGQKSRHIDIRYFFMQDRINTEGIMIKYCPTEQMLADFFTKPLQGSLFEKFRRVVMGHAHIDTLRLPTVVPTEERVGSNVERKTGKKNDSAVVTKVATPTRRGVRFMNGGSDVTTTVSTNPDGWTVVKGRRQTCPASLTSQANVTTEKRMSPRAHSLV